MKNTSEDLPRLVQLIEATAGTGLAILQGCEHLIWDSLKAGAAGCVSALANIAPEGHVAMFRAYQAGNVAEAETQQRHLAALQQIFRHELVSSSFSYFTYALKRILKHRGWLEHAHGLMPGFKPSTLFDDFLLEQIRDSKPH